jgi:hypothetical protein
VPGSLSFAQYHEVRAIALAEMIQIAGARSRRVAKIALALPATALARSLVALDGDLAGDSLRLAALTALRRFGVAPELDPVDAAMRKGPLLVVANHPGLFDALALFAAVGRDDLCTLAARRPLFDALPNLRRRLVVIEPDAAGGLALRRALHHLRRGGALLHFPAGRIEPDPRVAPRGTPLLQPWKPGLDTLLAAAARTCPDLRVAAALVSGVISPRALIAARWIGRLDRGDLSGQGRPDGLTDALVPLIQLTLPGFGDADVRVRFGPEGPLLPAGVPRLRASLAEMARCAAEPGGW